MKTGKQTIRGKNLGGRQGVALSPSGCSLGIVLRQEVQGLYIFSVKTLSVASLKLCTCGIRFFLGLVFLSSTFALFIALIVSLRPQCQTTSF